MNSLEKRQRHYLKHFQRKILLYYIFCSILIIVIGFVPFCFEINTLEKYAFEKYILQRKISDACRMLFHIQIAFGLIIIVIIVLSYRFYNSYKKVILKLSEIELKEFLLQNKKSGFISKYIPSYIFDNNNLYFHAAFLKVIKIKIDDIESIQEMNVKGYFVIILKMKHQRFIIKNRNISRHIYLENRLLQEFAKRQ